MHPVHVPPEDYERLLAEYPTLETRDNCVVLQVPIRAYHGLMRAYTESYHSLDHEHELASRNYRALPITPAPEITESLR